MMQDSYETFKKEYFSLSKIDLGLYKEGQMKRRIDNFVLKYKIKSYAEFIELLKKDTEAYDKFVAYLTINVSEFYRNPVQWQTLESSIIPELLNKYGNRLKIWSAACSTGDEPYSLAMVFGEFLPLDHIEILATDLDNDVLEKAKKGYYPEKSINGLPKKYQDKYIERDDTGVVKVSDKLKSCITFKQHNLLRDPYPKGIHIVVCRNVMIYFTDEAKDEIYRKFANSLAPKGILFVGSTEQIIGADKYGFTGLQSFFYEKK
ncbi:MAG: protein-glutamate O-methyltransferase CheR [Eubacterium sp.]|nr:protein-glutamate O-methyltransferase CheR [Eubacterium sp.]